MPAAVVAADSAMTSSHATHNGVLENGVDQTIVENRNLSKEEMEGQSMLESQF